MNFYILTLGCKSNQYESEFIAHSLQEKGFVRSFSSNADIIIINSCTVTGTGDTKVKKYLRRYRRENPAAVIALTGCMPQAFPGLSDEWQEADIITGNSSRRSLADEIERFISEREKIVNILPYKENDLFEEMAVTNFDERTRAFVKIEDGCNRFCSYCIIPYARGRVRSKPLEDLKKELTALGKNGYKEVVLVGINLSAYGSEFNLNLCDAVEAACNTEGIERVRLGSLEPERMDEDAIKRLSLLPKLCPQFHLSLQSGSTSVLKRMNRHYTADEYKTIVNNLKNAFENVSVTTDIMVGFPGETENEHKESMNFARKIGFGKVHVFAYSRRKGTVADKMPDQIDNGVKNQRSREMIEAANELHRSFLNSQLGRTESVLVESCKEGTCSGYTMNYTPVRFTGDSSLCGKIVNVRLTGVSDDYCTGEL